MWKYLLWQMALRRAQLSVKFTLCPSIFFFDSTTISKVFDFCLFPLQKWKSHYFCLCVSKPDYFIYYRDIQFLLTICPVNAKLIVLLTKSWFYCFHWCTDFKVKHFHNCTKHLGIKASIINNGLVLLLESNISVNNILKKLLILNY